MQRALLENHSPSSSFTITHTAPLLHH